MVVGSGVRGAFDSVGVMVGSFDHAWVGAVAAVVEFFEELRDGGFDRFLQSCEGGSPPGR